MSDSADGSETSVGSSSGADETDAELDAIANLRRDLVRGDECLDLRKLGATETETDPGVVVLVDLPPSNGAAPGEETAVRTYTLPGDAAEVRMRAFVGVADAAAQACEDEPMGTLFEVTAGALTVTYEVVDDGCLFTCERLFVEADGLVFERVSDGVEVEVEKLYVPGWIDPGAG